MFVSQKYFLREANFFHNHLCKDKHIFYRCTNGKIKRLHAIKRNAIPSTPFSESKIIFLLYNQFNDCLLIFFVILQNKFLQNNLALKIHVYMLLKENLEFPG